MGQRGRNGEKKIKQTSKEKMSKAQKEFTRDKAEKLIAKTTDPNVLTSSRIAKHANKHVKAKAEKKLEKLQKG